MSLQERINEKIIFEPNTGCWIWSGSLTACGGYGQISVNGRPKRAHRVTYELYKGAIKNDLLVCHHCDNPACVNPDHLFLGTYQQNTNDMVKKGRTKTNPRFGSHNGNSKLNESVVIEIRRIARSGISYKTIGEMFSISPATINQVVNYKTWVNITQVQ